MTSVPSRAVRGKGKLRGEGKLKGRLQVPAFWFFGLSDNCDQLSRLICVPASRLEMVSISRPISPIKQSHNLTYWYYQTHLIP